jgi:hypothetical protein
MVMVVVVMVDHAASTPRYLVGMAIHLIHHIHPFAIAIAISTIDVVIIFPIFLSLFTFLSLTPTHRIALLRRRIAVVVVLMLFV